MEKEMKKLLLVAVSVGIFLLVTITVALIVLTPKVQTQDTAFSSSVPYSHARPAAGISDKTPPQPQIIETPPIAVIDENGRPEVVIASDRNNGDSVTIQVQAPPSSAAETPSGTRPAAVITARPAAPAQTAAPARQPAAAARPPASAAAASTATGTTTARQSARTISDYWVQTGAYPSMVGAEDIRETLASKGLVGIVSIFDNQERDGKVWYRVRLGPYTSEREARHWLAIVKAIDGFDKSEVRQTIRQQ